MDKAPDYESGDSRFESWQVRNFSIRERQAAINSLIGRRSPREDGGFRHMLDRNTIQ